MTDLDALEHERERERDLESAAACAELESLYGFGHEVDSLLGLIARITSSISQRRRADGAGPRNAAA